MSASEKIRIIGMGDDGIEGVTAVARQMIQQADLLVGDERALASVPTGPAQRLEVGSDLDAVVEKIGPITDRKIVILASGDPLFYGVARYLCEKLDKDRIEIVPHVSSMQLAFARIKESWDEAYLANLATLSMDRVVEKIRTTEKAGLFTTETNPPSAVADALLDRKIDYFYAYVCENLGSPDERVTQGELAEISRQLFSPLNVLILVRKPGVADRPLEMSGLRLFGNPDEAFLQSRPKRGLLTPMEVRCLALAEMDLGPSSIVWDVGAGSGSVAIEAALIAAGGSTYAIEMDPEDYQLISENAQRFGAGNLVPVLGQAPEVWADLPDPDSIFVGGAGRHITRLVELAYQRLKSGGRLVANVGSIDNLATVHELVRGKPGGAKVRMINIAHGTDQLDRLRFESMNPTYLVSMVKA